MDIDYKEVIDCSRYKQTINESGIKIVFIAEKTGIHRDRISQVVRNITFPKTDMIANLAWAIKVPVSKVIDFKIDTDDKKKVWFESKALPYEPDSDAVGEVTYEPLRAMMNMYLDYLYDNTGKEKTVDDLFDLIEPYRRRNDIKSGVDYKVALEAKYGKDYVPKRSRVGQYKAKGLTPETRVKLKNDRPVNIRTIYDICNFFGCSIDWVMSYK